MKNIILLAPPAAGKGTLAKMLEKSFGYVSLSTGDLLREKSKTDKELLTKMQSGLLIDDQTVFSILKETISSLDKPYILDGFPRTVEQAKMYDELLDSLHKDLGVVIYLDIDKDILIQRVTSRVVCPKCKRSYSTLNKDLFPKVANICDDCNTKLIIRNDDKKEVFEKRYQEYLEKTSQLVNYYNKKKVLFKIDAIDSQKTLEIASELIK